MRSLGKFRVNLYRRTPRPNKVALTLRSRGGGTPSTRNSRSGRRSPASPPDLSLEMGSAYTCDGNGKSTAAPAMYRVFVETLVNLEGGRHRRMVSPHGHANVMRRVGRGVPN